MALKPFSGISSYWGATVKATFCNFDNMEYGSTGERSQMFSSHCNFSNIVYIGSELKNSGFINSYHDKYNNIGKTGVSSMGKYTSTYVENAKMENCKLSGVECEESIELKVKESDIKSSEIGISSTRVSSLFIDQSNIFEAKRGIFVNAPEVGQKGVITNSDIVTSSDIKLRDGIQVWGGDGFLIKSNRIEMNGDAHDSNGMYLLNPNNFLVKSNDVDIDSWSSGVSCVGGKKVDIGCNTIKCGPINPIYNLSVEQTGQVSSFYGNELTGGTDGAKFYGACNSFFAGNTMQNNANNAFYINKNSFIGDQLHKGNTFFSQVATCGSDPLLSKFLVSAKHPFPCNPKPERIPNVFTAQLFKDECEKGGVSTYDPKQSNCFSPKNIPYVFTNFETRVFTEDPFITGTYGEDLTRTTRKQLYRVLSDDHANLSGNELLIQEAFHDFQNTNIGKLYEVEKKIEDAYHSPFATLLSQKQESLFTLFEQIKSLDDEIASTVSEETRDELFEEQKIQTRASALLSSEIETLINQIDGYKVNLFDEARVLNDAIAADNIMDVNDREINNIYLNTVALGNIDFTDDDFSTISHIALQCPITGGDAVYRARVLYALKEPNERFESSITCQQLANKVQKNNLSSTENVLIVPNPANSEFVSSFKLPEGFTSAKVSLFNSLGMLVEEKDCIRDNPFLKWNTAHLNDGIYVLLYSSEGKILQQKRVVVVH